MVSDNGTIDTDRLVADLPKINIDFAAPDTPGGKQATLLNGENVETEIRHMAVSNAVSPVATIPQVRSRLVALQQQMGKEKGIVMDGRDIGTTVFPDAEMKVFVGASAQTRAQRRFLELEEKGSAVTYEEVLNNVVQRDHIDQTRTESPLRQADDAIVLDNLTMSVEQQDKWLLDLYHKIIEKQ